MKKIWLSIAFVLVFFVSCSTNAVDEGKEVELIISAAASLMGVMEEIKNDFETIHDDILLTFNFAGSGSLAQQIQSGAPVDLYISANQEWMNTLADNEWIQPDSRINVAHNQIVLVKKSKLDYESSMTFVGLSEIEELQIAIGDPATVSAGFFAKQVFEELGIWTNLKDKLVYGKDVQQVRTYVETDSVDYGVLFLSDTIVTDEIEVLDVALSSWHDPIVYPAAITSHTENVEAARTFLNFIASEAIEDVWIEYGFNQKH
ncbi:molybdate transport system substrate-binding protein [Natronobacillus azotifigens]|uniref:Molybdate-binding protein ModA n=1 Tax=Natronobacillus azotifigens TaxID=472978 RepID=A0A9J6REH7_9BACI|nr:molybdate ABC transporter substrate-binding protein [Natronobacillus azotifigens]